MTVAELIVALSGLNQDLQVKALYDGWCHVPVDYAWEAPGEDETYTGEPPVPFICLVYKHENVYHNSDRPAWAPREAVDKYWMPEERKYDEFDDCE